MDIKFSYDYTDLIHDIEDDLKEGSLTADADIQILRGEPVQDLGYAPVIDYYYVDSEMQELFYEDMLEGVKDTTQLKAEIQQYNKDKPHLLIKTVRDVLEELYLVTNPLGVTIEELREFI